MFNHAMKGRIRAGEWEGLGAGGRGVSMKKCRCGGGRVVRGAEVVRRVCAGKTGFEEGTGGGGQGRAGMGKRRDLLSSK